MQQPTPPEQLSLRQPPTLAAPLQSGWLCFCLIHIGHALIVETRQHNPRKPCCWETSVAHPKAVEPSGGPKQAQNHRRQTHRPFHGLVAVNLVCQQLLPTKPMCLLVHDSTTTAPVPSLPGNALHMTLSHLLGPHLRRKKG